MRLPSLRSIQNQLRAHASADGAKAAAAFHKTGAGEYADGQAFLGLNAATMHAAARQWRDLPLATIEGLLQSPIHDERAVALLIMVEQMKRADAAAAKERFDSYIANISRVDSWGLVDCSAPGIVGVYLENRSRRPLDRLARSKCLWQRRIAIVATLWFIRRNQFDDTLRLAERLLGDREDLIHKATGWMLREVGKRDQRRLERFLDEHVAEMPRTALRYAIERFPEPLRLHYLRYPTN